MGEGQIGQFLILCLCVSITKSRILKRNLVELDQMTVIVYVSHFRLHKNKVVLFSLPTKRDGWIVVGPERTITLDLTNTVLQYFSRSVPWKNSPTSTFPGVPRDSD